MRLNKFLAANSKLSRRKADQAILDDRVKVNGKSPEIGQKVSVTDVVMLDEVQIKAEEHQYVMMNKPIGYVCSRNPQGGDKSVYLLLPQQYNHLHTVGRLDKDSSGLLLFTNDGDWSHRLTHPSFEKDKVYEVTLDKSLDHSTKKKLEDGIQLSDGTSTVTLSGDKKKWSVTIHEGRNRQVRRTFSAVGINIISLHRIKMGYYILGDTKLGKTVQINSSDNKN